MSFCTESLLEFTLPQRQEILQKIVQRTILARVFDQKAAVLSKQNKGGNFHLCNQGHEIIGVAGGIYLENPKYMSFPYYRDRGFALGKGVSAKELFASAMARGIDQHSGGRMMPDHYGDLSKGLASQSSVVGSQMLQAVGYAKGIALKQEKSGVYVSLGDGATSQGDFHEALNFATIHKLPVLFVVQDNEWAISVKQSEQTSGSNIAKMISGYDNLQIHNIDGTCIEQVMLAYEKSIENFSQGPSVIVAKVPRMGPHSSSDNVQKYKSSLEQQKDIENDPLPKLCARVQETGLMTQKEWDDLWTETKAFVDKEAQEALEVAFEESISNDDAYKKHTIEEIQHPSEKKEPIPMATAINRALKEEMQRDSRIVVFGQDVADNKGGVFCITEGLSNMFGSNRCFNTPLAESTIMGLSLGLSLQERFLPVAEIQFADYIWTGINQLFNEIASFYFRSKGQSNLPLVIRMPTGGYIQGGPYHSQSIEAFLAHVPGLKVVLPSSARDAKCLLKASIRDPNPVVFLEHKALYRQMHYSANVEPTEKEIIPLGKGRLVQQGDEFTVITWGMGVLQALNCSRDQFSCDIIDLRTIKPFDKDIIRKSVEKTAKVLIIQEAPKTCGFGAEIASFIAEELFMSLDAPIFRVAGKDLPVPFAKHLEEMVLPSDKDIKNAMSKLQQY